MLVLVLPRDVLCTKKKLVSGTLTLWPALIELREMRLS